MKDETFGSVLSEISSVIGYRRIGCGVTVVARDTTGATNGLSAGLSGGRCVHCS